MRLERRSFLLSLAVWGGRAVAEEQDAAVKIYRDLEYAQAGPVRLLLDLHVPAKSDGARPVILAVHGGAFRSGNKESATGMFLARHGYAVASVNYRLSQQAAFPAQVHDCKAAVRWLRAHAGKYGLDPGRVGAIGSSAGGLLVGLLGTTAGNRPLEGDLGNAHESSHVNAVADLWGPSDLATLEEDAKTDPNVRPKIAHNVAGSPEAQLLGRPVAELPEMARLASPIRHVTARTCPFLLLHGDHDPLVPAKQSYRFFEALQLAGVSSRLYIGAGFGHGIRNPETEAMITAFFDEHLPHAKHASNEP